MKRLTVAILIVILSIFSYLIYANPKIVKAETDEFYWFPVVGTRLINSKIYYDAFSIEELKSKENHTYNRGILLVVYNETLELTTPSGNISTKSRMVDVITNCSTGVMTPITEFLFDIQFPKMKSVPIARKDHDPADAEKESIDIGMHTPMYKSLCPMYV